MLENCVFNRKRGVIPDFGGELYSGFDDQGLLWVCGHAWLLLHHKRAENRRVEKLIWIFVVVRRQLQPLAGALVPARFDFELSLSFVSVS